MNNYDKFITKINRKIGFLDCMIEISKMKDIDIDTRLIIDERLEKIKGEYYE